MCLAVVVVGGAAHMHYMQGILCSERREQNAFCMYYRCFSDRVYLGSAHNLCDVGGAGRLESMQEKCDNERRAGSEREREREGGKSDVAKFTSMSSTLVRLYAIAISTQLSFLLGSIYYMSRVVELPIAFFAVRCTSRNEERQQGKQLVHNRVLNVSHIQYTTKSSKN